MRPWACLHSGFSRHVSRGLVLMGSLVLIVASLLLSGSAPAAGAGVPTWWKVDLHEHSSFSGDARQDLGVLAAANKGLSYNAIFVTDHDRSASFSIQGANGNYIDYRDALSGRWTQKTVNAANFANTVVASPDIPVRTRSILRSPRPCRRTRGRWFMPIGVQRSAAAISRSISG